MVASCLGIFGGVWATEEKARHPIATFYGDGGYLIGGLVGGKWEEADILANWITGQTRYSVFTISGKIGEVVGEKPTEDDFYQVWKVAFKGDGQLAQESARQKNNFASVFDARIAAAVNWDALPRTPKLLPCNTTSYNSIIYDFLKRRGLRSPQVVKHQVIKIDLEGDGVDEVLLTASNFIVGEYDNSPMFPTTRKKGKYSIVILRKVINGKAQNIELASELCLRDEDFGAGPPYASYVPFILDVDGDGQMEIFVQSNYYEGWGYEVYKVKGNKAFRVLGFGIGA